MEKHYSEWTDIHCEIPEGSILGPLLFIIYINELPLAINSELISFADDTTAFVKCNSLLEVEKSMKH